MNDSSATNKFSWYQRLVSGQLSNLSYNSCHFWFKLCSYRADWMVQVGNSISIHITRPLRTHLRGKFVLNIEQGYTWPGVIFRRHKIWNPLWLYIIQTLREVLVWFSFSQRYASAIAKVQCSFVTFSNKLPSQYHMPIFPGLPWWIDNSFYKDANPTYVQAS